MARFHQKVEVAFVAAVPENAELVLVQLGRIAEEDHLRWVEPVGQRQLAVLAEQDPQLQGDDLGLLEG